MTPKTGKSNNIAANGLPDEMVFMAWGFERVAEVEYNTSSL
jgi:hypothetical protein